MDFDAKLVISGKWLAKELDLEPCPFTIVTSIRSTKHATDYIR
nr:hypothetical protein PHYPA_031223 [Physcomitrium patens]